MKKAIFFAVIVAVAITACGGQGFTRRTGFRLTETALAESGGATLESTAAPTVTLPATQLPPTSTPAPTTTAAPTLGLFPFVTFAQDVNCRLGPAKGYYVIEVFTKGQITQINGRSADGSWINVPTRDNTKYCWATVSALKDPLSIDSLRVLDSQPLPAVPWGFNVSSMACTGIIAVHLSWETDETASGYHLYRDGGLIHEFTPGQNSFVDQPPPRKSYTYAIQAVNALGVSGTVSLTQAGCG